MAWSNEEGIPPAKVRERGEGGSRSKPMSAGASMFVALSMVTAVSKGICIGAAQINLYAIWEP